MTFPPPQDTWWPGAWDQRGRGGHKCQPPALLLTPKVSVAVESEAFWKGGYHKGPKWTLPTL